MVENCWIFGDESGAIESGRFFAIGLLGTRNPKAVVEKLRAIREKAEFQTEISYKFGSNKMALCALKWMDWFFSGQKDIRCRILLKDFEEFKINYFEGNKYSFDKKQLAYCHSYKEALARFSPFESDNKALFYSKTGLIRGEIENYLEGKVTGFSKERCYARSPSDKKPGSGEFTVAAEILQLCDLLTSATRGFCCSLFEEEKEQGEVKWVKNCLRKNVHYHVGDLKEKIKGNKSVYFPGFSERVFEIYNWKGGKYAKSTPI